MKTKDTMREMLAEVIANGLLRDFPNASIAKNATTSDCPMVCITMASGDAFNITVTRKRS